MAPPCNFYFNMKTQHRVVVTGLGIISPIGNDVPTFWDNLKKGVCGIEKITEFDTSEFPAHVAAKIKDFDPLQYGMDKAFVRKQGMFTQYGVAAARQAMDDAGLKSEEKMPTSTPSDSAFMWVPE